MVGAVRFRGVRIGGRDDYVVLDEGHCIPTASASRQCPDPKNGELGHL
jgi:hypothetical protein